MLRIPDELKRYITFPRKFEEVREYSHYIMDNLKKLEEITPTLVTKEGIIEIFSKDVNLIKEDYKKGNISKREAEKLLEDLHGIAGELERYISEIRELFLKLEESSRSISRKFIEPPEFGVPITVVKEEVRKVINRVLKDGVPKREFGVLELANLSESDVDKKIHDFIDEHSSGLVITLPELERCVIKILNNARVKFETKKVGRRTIFIVEGFE